MVDVATLGTTHRGTIDEAQRINQLRRCDHGCDVQAGNLIEPARTRWLVIRDAETANIPFLDALTGVLRCCSSVVWPATLPSERLALHPASTLKTGTLAISVPLNF